MMYVIPLEKMIALYGWRDVPDYITSREGYSFKLQEDHWRLFSSTGRGISFNFSKIKNPNIKWALKKYVAHRIETTSCITGSKCFNDVWRLLIKSFANEILPDQDFQSALMQGLEKCINKARTEHKLYQTYEVIQWYIWCAERYPEIGFNPHFALELESLKIPGGPKGEAVRMQDPETGPLHRTLEFPLIIEALRNDSVMTLKALQERAVVALSLGLGRNPTNLVHILESDFEDLTPMGSDRTYLIQIPRIKKRQLRPRDDKREEYLSPELGRHIVALKSRNASIPTVIKLEDRKVEIPRPLFCNVKMNSVAYEFNQLENLFNVSTEYITTLLQSFVLRHQLISPVTGQPLEITTRRMRYTLATNLASDGISKRELARILDHSDTQHVQVYFDIARNIVPHLDRATAKEFSKYVTFFKGNIVHENSGDGFPVEKNLAYYDQTNPIVRTDIGLCGQMPLCHLDPPFSCYLCPKFQPYLEADHEHVLDSLIQNRNISLHGEDKARLGVQMDDVIAAVAQVVKMCKEINDEQFIQKSS